jgi:hypothetical protein
VRPWIFVEEENFSLSMADHSSMAAASEAAAQTFLFVPLCANIRLAVGCLRKYVVRYVRMQGGADH